MKAIVIKVVLFDDSELLWVSPFPDIKSSITTLKGSRWLEVEGKHYNTDYILYWEIAS